MIYLLSKIYFSADYGQESGRGGEEIDQINDNPLKSLFISIVISIIRVCIYCLEDKRFSTNFVIMQHY